MGGGAAECTVQLGMSVEQEFVEFAANLVRDVNLLCQFGDRDVTTPRKRGSDKPERVCPKFVAVG